MCSGEGGSSSLNPGVVADAGVGAVQGAALRDAPLSWRPPAESAYKCCVQILFTVVLIIVSTQHE